MVLFWNFFLRSFSLVIADGFAFWFFTGCSMTGAEEGRDSQVHRLFRYTWFHFTTRFEVLNKNYLNAAVNRWIFNLDLNKLSVSADLRLSGSLFQTCGA